MRGKVLIVAVAIVLGGIAAVMTFGYLGTLEQQVTAGSQMVGVYVAKQDIPRGATAADLASRGLIQQVQMPKRYVAQDAITTVDGLGARVLATPVSKGEVLTSGRFESADQAGLAFSVPKGFIAMTIPVDDARGVAGLISPGDHVTVFATVQKTSVRDQETRIIVPGVLVLAVGQNTAAQTQKPAVEAAPSGVVAAEQSGSGTQAGSTSIVTVAIAPAQAEKVVFAIESGSIWLGLLPGESAATIRGAGQTSTSVLK